MERSVVSYGASKIAYGVQRSARRRTVSISVDAQRRVVVTAPDGTSLERLDAVIRAKAPWIVERLRRRSDVPPPMPQREFVSGENFYYLGKQHRLCIERGVAVAPVRLLDGRLRLPLPAGLPPRSEGGYARAALIDWYVARAEEVLPRRVHRWSKRVGVRPQRVLVNSTTKRWGSVTSDQTLRLNWRIVQAPTPLIDYVVVHELVHLLHFDHSAAFWRELERVLPEFAPRRARLRELGPAITW